MAWVKLDDQFFFKPRSRQAGRDGRALFFAGLCYCAANRTDGRIVNEALPLVAGMAEVEQGIAHLLCDIGLWIGREDHYEVVDFLKFNPSREQLEADAQAAAERQARSREKSRRDSRRDNGVSSTAPSPLPSPLTSSSSSGQVNFPAGLWMKVAEKQMAASSVPIGSPAAWKRKAAANAKAEYAERAAWLWATYEITESQLVDVLCAGGSSPLLNSLRKREAA